MTSRQMRMTFAACAVTAVLAVTLVCAGCRGRAHASSTSESPVPKTDHTVAKADAGKPIVAQSIVMQRVESSGSYQLAPEDGKSIVTDVMQLACGLNALSIQIKSFPDVSASPDSEFTEKATNDLLQLQSILTSPSNLLILKVTGDAITPVKLDEHSDCSSSLMFARLPTGKAQYLVSSQDAGIMTDFLTKYAKQLNALALAQNQIQKTFGNADSPFARSFDMQIKSLGQKIRDTQGILYGRQLSGHVEFATVKLPDGAVSPLFELPTMVAVDAYIPVKSNKPNKEVKDQIEAGPAHIDATSLVLLLALIVAVVVATLSVKGHKKKYVELEKLLEEKETEVTRLREAVDNAKREVETARNGYDEARDACLLAKAQFEQSSQQSANERDDFLKEYRRESGDRGAEASTSAQVTQSASLSAIPIGKPKPGEGTHIPGNPDSNKEAETMSIFTPPPTSPESPSGIPREPIPTGDPLKDYLTARAMDLTEGESWFCRNYDTKGISCKNLETYGSITSPKLQFELNKRGVFLGVVFQKYLLALPSFSYDYTARKAMEGVYVYPAGGGAPTKITQPAILDVSGDGWVLKTPGVFQ